MARLGVLVTGGTSGIGAAIGEAFASRGAEVTAVGRDPDRGERWAREVRRRGGEARFLAGDLGDQKRVLALAETVKLRGGPLGLLVNNAGGVWERRETTPDGLERTLALNHVHPFLLTACLFPLLRASRGRVIFTSTGYHGLVSLGARDWSQQRFDSGMNVYGRAKRISLLVGRAAAPACAREGVLLQFADPGMAWTSLTSRMGPGYFPWYGRFLVPSIHAVQKRIPLAWTAAPYLALTRGAGDPRPGAYAWPGGPVTCPRPGKGDPVRGRWLWSLTLDRWLGSEARRAVSASPLGRVS